MPPLNYRDAIAYIIQREGYDRGFVANPFDSESIGLRRTEALLEMLDFPDRRYPTIHVAGSKGKGSTSAALDSILRASGYRVGLYTTPHLHTFRERIQIDGAPISEAEFGLLTGEIIPLNERVAKEHPDWGEATAFEASTVLAFLAFARAGVNAAVIEVGLGGRLDATNVITPVVSVITSISLDHVSILGNTLEEIATEKAGIIKPDRPVISADQPPEATTTLQRIADERGSRLLLGGRDWHASGTTRDFDVTGPSGTIDHLSFGLAGQHQIENAGLAVTVARELVGRGFRIPDESLRAGLADVSWPGRFEIGRTDPVVVLDGAHNVDSARRLAETLSEEFPGRKVHLIVGIARDKDVPGMLAHLVPLAASVTATASRSPRASDPESLVDAINEINPLISAASVTNVSQALDHLVSSLGPDEVICVTGSLYVVAEAREALGLAEPADFEQELLYR